MRTQLTLKERFQRLVQSFNSELNRDRKFLARAEFWVYLPGESLPAQDEIMNRMMLANPFAVRGVSPIGSAEGILFSDIRTHIALMLKKHNQIAFKGITFPDTVEPTPEQVSLITTCESIAKVSYISEEPLSNRSYLSFITHAASAIADLAEGTLIYDLVGERLWDKSKFEEVLRKSPKGESPELHVRTIWHTQGGGNRVVTRGLAKLGLPELRTAEMERDQRVVTENIVAAAADLVWANGVLDDEQEVELFGDKFKIEVTKRARKTADIRLLRIQSAR